MHYGKERKKKKKQTNIVKIYKKELLETKGGEKWFLGSSSCLWLRTFLGGPLTHLPQLNVEIIYSEEQSWTLKVQGFH